MTQYGIRPQPGSNALRKGRWSETGRYYVLTTATHVRKPLFRDIWAGRIVVEEMRRLDHDEYVKSMAWVLMPDHLHWLLEVGQDVSLSGIMMYVKGRAAHRINSEIHYHGRIWNKGFHDHALRKEDDVRNIARYIIANPLRAGLVRHIGEYPLWDAVWL